MKINLFFQEAFMIVFDTPPCTLQAGHDYKTGEVPEKKVDLKNPPNLSLTSLETEYKNDDVYELLETITSLENEIYHEMLDIIQMQTTKFTHVLERKNELIEHVNALKINLIDMKIPQDVLGKVLQQIQAFENVYNMYYDESTATLHLYLKNMHHGKLFHPAV
jgi:hypothetical protein